VTRIAASSTTCSSIIRRIYMTSPGLENLHPQLETRRHFIINRQRELTRQRKERLFEAAEAKHRASKNPDGQALEPRNIELQSTCSFRHPAISGQNQPNRLFAKESGRSNARERTFVSNDVHDGNTLDELGSWLAERRLYFRLPSIERHVPLHAHELMFGEPRSARGPQL
jgi:hypothetical protein